MLTMSRPLATRLLHQAQTHPDQRVCGLLLARNDEAESIRPLTNVADDPARDIRFDGEEFAAAKAAAEQAGLHAMALYYSHPHDPPLPSAADLAARPAADLPQLIISLNIKGVLEMRAFAPDGDSVREVPVQVFQ